MIALVTMKQLVIIRVNRKQIYIKDKLMNKTNQFNKTDIIFQGSHSVMMSSLPWWCHQMETFSALLAICGRSPVNWPVNSPHKGQCRGALMFSLICARLNGWVNNREAGDLGRHCVHYDVTVMECFNTPRVTHLIGTDYIQSDVPSSQSKANQFSQ